MTTRTRRKCVMRSTREIQRLKRERESNWKNERFFVVVCCVYLVVACCVFCMLRRKHFASFGTLKYLCCGRNRAAGVVVRKHRGVYTLFPRTRERESRTLSAAACFSGLRGIICPQGNLACLVYRYPPLPPPSTAFQLFLSTLPHLFWLNAHVLSVGMCRVLGLEHRLSFTLFCVRVVCVCVCVYFFIVFVFELYVR